MAFPKPTYIVHIASWKILTRLSIAYHIYNLFEVQYRRAYFIQITLPKKKFRKYNSYRVSGIEQKSPFRFYKNALIISNRVISAIIDYLN
jgi:hypothetical protein